MGYITSTYIRFCEDNESVSKLFRAYGLYNRRYYSVSIVIKKVSKLFRAYGLYNNKRRVKVKGKYTLFQSSFELMGYITHATIKKDCNHQIVSKLFRAYGLYNIIIELCFGKLTLVSKLFRAYGLYNCLSRWFRCTSYHGVSKLFRAYGLYNNKLDIVVGEYQFGFKALSS